MPVTSTTEVALERAVSGLLVSATHGRTPMGLGICTSRTSRRDMGVGRVCYLGRLNRDGSLSGVSGWYPIRDSKRAAVPLNPTITPRPTATRTLREDG